MKRIIMQQEECEKVGVGCNLLLQYRSNSALSLNLCLKSTTMREHRLETHVRFFLRVSGKLRSSRIQLITKLGMSEREEMLKAVDILKT